MLKINGNFGSGTMNIKQLLPEVKENVSLAEHTTFKIGGRAKYFFTAKTKQDIIKAIKAAQEKGLVFFVLVHGSNVLFSDNGFNGLVIKLQTTNYKLQANVIYAEAGAKLSDIVQVAIEAGLSGLEWAAGIPGSVGGAVRGNAGAFGSSMADLVETVEALDISQIKGQSFVIKNYGARDCLFGYRYSIFKENKNLIVLSAKIQLKKGNKQEIKKQVEGYRDYRKEHHPLEFPSVGSIFKNLSLGDFRTEIFAKFPELNNFREQGTVPAGFLIEKTGLKGKTIGQAQISEKHCNFIINLGRAKAKDVLDLIELVKQKVKENFGVELEQEIMIVEKNSLDNVLKN